MTWEELSVPGVCDLRKLVDWDMLPIKWQNCVLLWLKEWQRKRNMIFLETCSVLNNLTDLCSPICKTMLTIILDHRVYPNSNYSAWTITNKYHQEQHHHCQHHRPGGHLTKLICFKIQIIRPRKELGRRLPWLMCFPWEIVQGFP